MNLSTPIPGQEDRMLALLAWFKAGRRGVFTPPVEVAPSEVRFQHRRAA